MRALTVAALLLATAAHAQDGKTLFARRCAACHSLTAAKSSPTAPRIAGVAGRKVASLPDYAYSSGLKAKGGQSWSDANLNAYLAAPQTWAPGTKMFVNLPDAKERSAMVAYLKTLK